MTNQYANDHKNEHKGSHPDKHTPSHKAKHPLPPQPCRTRTGTRVRAHTKASFLRHLGVYPGIAVLLLKSRRPLVLAYLVSHSCCKYPRTSLHTRDQMFKNAYARVRIMTACLASCSYRKYPRICLQTRDQNFKNAHACRYLNQGTFAYSCAKA